MAELTTTDMALLERVATGSVSSGRVMNAKPDFETGPYVHYCEHRGCIRASASPSVGRSRIGSALSIGPIGVPAAGDRHLRA